MAAPAAPDYPERTVHTYFGDYLHGLFIEWKSKPSADEGSSDVEIKLTANMRSKLHVYGYTGDYFNPQGSYTKDVAEDWDYFFDYALPDAATQP